MGHFEYDAEFKQNQMVNKSNPYNPNRCPEELYFSNINSKILKWHYNLIKISCPDFNLQEHQYSTGFNKQEDHQDRS